MALPGRHRGQYPQNDGIAQELGYLPLVQTAAPSLVATVAVAVGISATLTSGAEPKATVPVTVGISATLEAFTEPSAAVPVIVGITADLSTSSGLAAAVPVTVGIRATLTTYSGLAATVPVTIGIRGQAVSRQTEAVNGQLGCGVYEVIFFQRGATIAAGSLPFSDLKWGRKLDGVSEAEMTITGLMGSNAQCCGIVSSLRPWQHEMGIYRDGRRVWCGPLVTVDVEGETCTFGARDLAQWFTRRRLRSDHVYAATDLATIFQAYAADALSVDNSMGLLVVASLCGILGDRSVLSDQHFVASDEMDELSRTGVDWSVVDRQIYIGGQQVPVPAPTAGSLLLLDESFMSPPKVTLDGMAQANDWLVRGAGTGQIDDTVGEASDAASQATYGWLDQVVTEEAIMDPASATTAAATRLALTGGTPHVVSSGVLAPQAGVTIELLVPGQQIELRINEVCVPILTRYRLSAVDVSVSASQDEQVTVGFQPLGTEGTT